METLVKDKIFVEKKEIDWVSQYSEAKVTLSDYRNEMYAAERSGDITHEQFQTNMHQQIFRKHRNKRIPQYYF